VSELTPRRDGESERRWGTGEFPNETLDLIEMFFARRIMESGSEDGELPRRRRVSRSHAGDGEPQGEGLVLPERIGDGISEIRIPHRRAETIADEVSAG
jgi:hypothetical protein